MTAYGTDSKSDREARKDVGRAASEVVKSVQGEVGQVGGIAGGRLLPNSRNLISV